MKHIFVTIFLFISFSSIAQVGPILGTPIVCMELTTSLSDATTGGTWSSSNPAIGTVGSTGIVTGIVTGTTTISYTVGATSSTLVVTVNAYPGFISGPPSVCIGSAIVLSDPTAGGTWSNSCPAYATIGISGVVTGISAGTCVFTYTLPTGCIATTVETIDPIPSTITGLSGPLCIGSCATLAVSPAGGTWSGTPATVFTISPTGTVCGVSAGAGTITYTIATGCMVSVALTVDPAPGAIVGNLNVCQGLTTALSDLTPGGVWSSANPGVASVSTGGGLVTGNTAGTAEISYAVATGCAATVIVTVNPSPGALSIPSLCVGTCETLTAGGGGTWSTSSGIVTIGLTTGLACGVSTGTATLTYTLPTGCISTYTLTVNITAAAIMGPDAMCAASTATLSDATTGGTWTSSNTSVITISSGGAITSMAYGTSMISYTAGTGCTAAMTVTVVASVPSLTGNANICVGSITTLSDTYTGGTWASSNTAVASVGSATSIISGVGMGTATITYTLGSIGCIATAIVTINPDATITGSSSLNVGGYDTMTVSPSGGTWSGGSGIVTISGNVLYGASAGVTTITYTSPAGCSATITVTVSTPPTGISGPGSVCIGSSITLSDATAGGTWSCSSGSGSVTIGSFTGIVTGVTAGTATITYTLPTSGYATTTVTVVPTPTAIGGPNQVCVGSVITLTDAIAGGTWSSSNVTIASAGTTTGLVTGVSAGIAIITYTVGTGCFVTYSITVNPLPSGIGSGSTLCVGSCTTLSGSGGAWSSGSGVSVTAGTACGVSVGVATLTYTISSGCSSTTTITVNALPTISATATSNCGGTYSITGSGGSTYTWAPPTGLSCTACTTAIATISTTATYTATGTDVAGCSNTGTVAVNGNRISGYFTMTVTPTDTLKVWLIQFSPIDSSLTAEDSTLSCMDSGTPYYEFDNSPAGSYMVKAKLLSSVPGTSGYVPTYGLSSNLWSAASTVTHANATDTQHINMIYGTVPAGPGFIGGLISAGAGRNTTTTAPVSGMLVYLENTSGTILTYAYTDTSGVYSFSGLAYGTYNIYPVDYHYHTTPWMSVTLTSTNDSAKTADFIEHTTSHTIIPIGGPLPVCCSPINSTPRIIMYPNPAVNELNINWAYEKTGDATVIISDITGREIYNSTLDISTPSGSALLDIHALNSGIYFITIKAELETYTNKLLIQR